MRGRHARPFGRIAKWTIVTVGSVAGGLMIAVAAMLASLVLIWAVTALLSYFL